MGSHTRPRHTRRLFAVVVHVKQGGNVYDTILNLPMMEIEEEKTIVGLPSIAGKRFIWLISRMSWSGVRDMLVTRKIGEARHVLIANGVEIGVWAVAGVVVSLARDG